MDKKEKISIILKILLVLVLVPIGVSFGWSNDALYQQFTNTTQPNLDNYIDNNQGESYYYNYEGAKGAITGQWDQSRQLLYSSRIFCLRKGIDPGTKNSFPEIPEDPNEKSDTEIKHIYQEPENPTPNDISLTAVPQFDEYGNVIPGTANNMAYALSFYKVPDSGNVNDDERAQKTIWAYNGADESSYQEDGLYKANQKYVEMDKMKNEARTGDIRSISLTKGGTTDTTKFGSHLVSNESGIEYILVGPYHISNHPYADGVTGFSNGVDIVENISDFSGKDLSESKDTLVGLIKSEVIIESEDGTNRTLSSSDYNICYDNEGKVMYNKASNADNSKIQKTDYTSAYNNLNIPASYMNNSVPFPDNDFYIKIKSSEIKVGDKLKKFTLTARDTKADGDGCYITSKIVTETFNKNEEKICLGGYCDNCGEYEFEDCSKYSDKNSIPKTHNCGEEENEAKYTCGNDDGIENKPHDFIWKTVAVSSDGNTFGSKNYPEKTANNNKPETLQWALAVTVNSEIFNDMYTHIISSLKNSDLPKKISKNDKGIYIKGDGKKIDVDKLKKELQKPITCGDENCNCKAFIFLGANEGASNITHGNGYMLDVYIGENFYFKGADAGKNYTDNEAKEGIGFIKRLNPSDGVSTYKELYKSKETWVIRNGVFKDAENKISHYHNGNCYYKKDSNDSPEYKLKCGKSYYSYVHKIKNSWIHRTKGDPHKHTTKCWKEPTATNEKGNIVHNDESIFWYNPTDTSTNQQPFLIVNSASTTVLKKEISIDGPILKTDVTVHKYIDNVSGSNTATGTDIQMKNGNTVGYANDCDYSAAIEEDRKSNNINQECTYVSESADRYQYKYEFVPDPRYPQLKGENTALQTEDWKKEHPAVIEAGDSITYKIVLKNNSNKKVNITVEDKLPENLTDTISEGILYIKRIDTKADHNVYITSNDNDIKSFPKTYIKDKTLHTRNFPGAIQINNEYYIEMDADEEITYSIKIHKISSAENSYDELNPVANTATITGIYRADVDSNDENYLRPIANENISKNVSRDYYLCKKYNVSVNSAITDMFRTGSGATKGTQISTTEKVVDNAAYDFFNNKRLSLTDSTRSAYPLYAENGDCITYQIRLKDNATTSAPYYRPKQVKASVKVTKPTTTAEVVGAITSQDTTTKKSIGTINYDSTTEMLTDITIPEGHEIIIWITFRINNNKTTTYDYNTLREVKASITKLTNINGKTTTDPNEEGVAYCKMSGKCSSCRRTANTEENCPYCQKVNSMTEIIDGSISNGGEILNNVNKAQATSSDYFRIKEYNIVVDKYISKVEHNPNRNNTSEPGTTFDSESRRIDITDPSVKEDGSVDKGGGGTNSDEVYVEYGDKVTYTILIYNTTDNTYYNVGRDGAPYKAPQNVYVDVQDTLPNKYTDLTVFSNIASQEPSKDNENHQFTILNNNIPANDIGTITVTLVVDESTKEKIETNTVTISNWKNINGYTIINNGNRNSASDKYKLNDYKATLDEYISEYNAEMAKYNNSNGFTTGEIEGLKKDKDNNTIIDYPNNAPLDLEKYEKYTIATKVTNTNTSSELTDESSQGTYSKYKTRVRPSEVSQTLEYGLKHSGFKATWYTSSGGTKTFKDKDGNERTDGNITSYITRSELDNENDKKKTHTYTINDDNIILSPGEYIIYETTVEVTESNLCLKNLKSNSKIEILTNINKTSSEDREVTLQNTVSDEETKDENYVRLKDVIIAGTVWLDTNKDGYKQNESGKDGVTVKLYKSDGTLVATTTSGTASVTFNDMDNSESVTTGIESGTGNYSFGRVWKATSKDSKQNYNSTNYINYYVEFEYDGVKYKATDVYGGDSDGQADGMHNLNTKASDESEGGSKWRQGYSDLPGTTSGKTGYMTDSNAYEFDNVRNNFNNEYQTIGFNQSYKTNEANKDIEANKSLSYTKEEHQSTLEEDPNRTMKARSFITQDFSNKDGISESIGNTNTLFLQSYGGHSNEYPETEYLKFINLGLVEREKVDVSIESDVESVKTTINGEEMTYRFGTNDADSTASNYNDHDNAYKLKDAYNLNLYTADYNYKNDQYYGNKEDVNDKTLIEYKGEESELTAEVTYRTRIASKAITNDEPSWEDEDIKIETAINEIAVYYDKNFISNSDLNKFLEDKTTVKEKDNETGIFKNKIFNSIRVNYGTEEELNKGTATDIRNQISFTSRYSNNKTAEDASDKGYNVLYLTGSTMDNTYIKEGEEKYIEITFVVDKDEARNLLINEVSKKEDSMGLEMIAEVSAYTTKYGSGYIHKGLAGKDAGLVDIDSNPGNLNVKGIESYDNYEDDKYKVGVRINKFDDSNNNTNNNTRTISGFVWDDARSKVVGKDTDNDGTVDSEIQYLGNGEYKEDDANNTQANTNPNDKGENKDKSIEGVKVSLVEVVQIKGKDENNKEFDKYYEYPAKDSNGNLIEAVTDSDGKYTLSDYIPGYYKVRFDYGYNKDDTNNILYNGQDYKSTTYYNEYTDENDNKKALYYENSQGYATDNIGSKDNFTYFDKVKSALSKANKSDAQDDEIRRLNVNSYSETMTTTQGEIFSETSVTKTDEVKEITDLEDKGKVENYLKTNDEKLTKNTQMFAESTIFYAKPEQVLSNNNSIDATDKNFDTDRLWNISNLDFGLEYRPESSIVLDKNISTLELVTSDNKTLVKLYLKDDENGVRVIDEKKSKGYENVQFLANNGKKEQGFVYINMDTEILEGCTIKADYEISTENQSEVDRINKNLDAIKFEKGANNYGTNFKVYTTHESQDNEDKEYSYNANATAAKLLASQYYNEYNIETETYDYLTKLKKPYNSSGATEISNPISTDANNKVELAGQGYYGMYLGQTYYTGNIGTNDKVAELKVDHILDYIDNDFKYDTSENSTKDRLWKTTTSDELYNRRLLDFGKVNTEKEENEDGKIRYNLIDQYGIRYDTENRSNLTLTVDDNNLGQYWSQNDNGEDEYSDRIGNNSLSKFLKIKETKTDIEKYSGKINVTASKVLSGSDLSHGKSLTYNNLAEVIQYTSLTGRKTKLPDGSGNGGVVGNANVEDILTGYLNVEDDTDATEVITISPPTGLVK